MKDFGKLTFAVVGATGALGRELVEGLGRGTIAFEKLKLLASEPAEEPVEFRGRELTVERLDAAALRGVDLVFLADGSAVSAEYGPPAAAAGAVVIDCASPFRRGGEVPLIVPEVNALEVVELLKGHAGRGFVVANPNSATIPLVVILHPILKEAGLERVLVSTYHSVSGAGEGGADELWDQTLAVFNQEQLARKVFPHPIAFNLIPQVDAFLENGYTVEEMRIIDESRRILGRADLRMTVTAAYVPVFSGHSESVNVETSKPLSPAQARQLLTGSPGVLVLDDPGTSHYPTPLEIANPNVTHVGRIRRDDSVTNGLNVWIVADNLRKGAVVNAIQIAEIVVDFWKRSGQGSVA